MSTERMSIRNALKMKKFAKVKVEEFKREKRKILDELVR